VRVPLFFNCAKLPANDQQKQAKVAEKGQGGKEENDADHRNRRRKPHRHRILLTDQPLLRR